VVKTACFRGALTPPGGERIACGAFYEVTILMPTQNESNFNELLERKRWLQEQLVRSGASRAAGNSS
jgi:hypothetical protein